MIDDQPSRRPVTRPLIATALLLMVPLVAMQLTGEVVWTLADFVVAGVLLFVTGLSYELAARRMGSGVYRAAIGLALGAALFLVWVNLAVGVIGTESNPANAMYLGVLAVGLIGSTLARLRPSGMAVTLLAMALAHAIIAAIAIAMGLGEAASGPVEIIGVNALFMVLFIGAALLFRNASRRPPRVEAVPA